MRTAIRAVQVAAAVLVVAGCAAGDDVFGEPGAGYVTGAAERTAAAERAKAETVTVELSEFAFSPSTLTFRAGATYRLVIENTGDRAHFFVSDGFFKAIAAQVLRSAEGEVAGPYLEKIAVAPGKSKELLFVAVTPGRYALVCTVFLHETFGMSGEVRIL